MDGFLRRNIWRILSSAFFEWNEDRVMRMAGALAFYTIFSLTPTIVISMRLAEAFVTREEAHEAALEQVEYLIGSDGKRAVEEIVESAPPIEQASTLATIAGLVTMFFAATAAFAELKDAMNTIWEVKPKPGLGIVRMIRDRMLSFAMVLVIGFFLLVSLMISTVLGLLDQRFSRYVPTTEMAISFLIIAFLFALIYKYLPDAHVHWRDVWFGAAVTSVMFAIGKTAFGLYLGNTTIGSSYGIASSLVIVVLWVYYSACILLFGAEITQVQAKLRGEHIEPTESAVHLTEHDRIQQGMPHEEEIEQSVRDAEEVEHRHEPEAPPSRPAERGGVVTTLLAFAAGYLVSRRRKDGDRPR